jgi:hypothetical protein
MLPFLDDDGTRLSQAVSGRSELATLPVSLKRPILPKPTHLWEPLTLRNVSAFASDQTLLLMRVF